MQYDKYRRKKTCQQMYVIVGAKHEAIIQTRWAIRWRRQPLWIMATLRRPRHAAIKRPVAEWLATGRRCRTVAGARRTINIERVIRRWAIDADIRRRIINRVKADRRRLGRRRPECCSCSIWSIARGMWSWIQSTPSRSGMLILFNTWRQDFWKFWCYCHFVCIFRPAKI